MIKAQDLIMVCVRQLVQDHRRMLEQLGSREELSGYRDVDFASQSGIMLVGP